MSEPTTTFTFNIMNGSFDHNWCGDCNCPNIWMKVFTTQTEYVSIEFYHNPKSFLISSFTVLRYLVLFSCDTNGTDQNCFVFNHLLSFQPNTKVNTPNTNLSLTELRYKVFTGSVEKTMCNVGSYPLIFEEWFWIQHSLVMFTNLYVEPGVNTSSKNTSILGVNLNHQTGDIK